MLKYIMYVLPLFKSTLCTFERMTNNHTVEVQALEFELIVLHYFLFLWKLTVLYINVIVYQLTCIRTYLLGS